MTSTIDKQAHELATKHTTLEKAIERACKSEQEVKLLKAESKNTTDAAEAYQHQLQSSIAQNKLLEQKLNDAREKIAESDISQHKLRKQNECLRLGECCRILCYC